MAFKLNISLLVLFAVAGTLTDARGAPVPFSFKLEAERLSAEELAALSNGPEQTTVSEVLTQRVKGWSGVQDDDGAEVPFSPEAFKGLLSTLGMASLCYLAYLQACGAKGKEKN